MKKTGIVAVILLAITTLAFAQVRFFKQRSITVNPYTAVTITDTNVKGFCLYAPSIGYKFSLDGVNYTPMTAGGSFNFETLQMDAFSLKLQGSTATDTGTVHYIILK